MNSALTSVVFFVAGLVGAAMKAYLSNDQATFSRKSLGDVILGGLTGILMPLLTPGLLPVGANVVQQAAVVAIAAYFGSDLIQNALQKLGIRLPAGLNKG